MIKNTILYYIGAFLFSACAILSCQNLESDFVDQGSVLMVSASFEKDATRVSLEESSLSLVSRWSPGDRFDIYANGELIARNVPAGNFSEDWKSCSFGVPIPEGKFDGDIELVCATTNSNPTLIDGKLFFNASLVRMPIANYYPPVVGKATVTDLNKISVKFRHYLTYEIVHVLNHSGKEITFSLNGFSTTKTWYASKGAVAEDGTFLVDTPATEEPIKKSSTIRIPDSGSEVILSAYIPTRYPIEEAKMVAEIDGQDVTSVNSKSSILTLQTAHAYHMYVEWNGQELKFVGQDSGGDIVVDPMDDFGPVVIGQTEYKYLTIHNNGEEERTVKVSLEDGTYGGPFDLPNAELGDDYVYKIIPAGEHRSVKVSFRPRAVDDYSGTLVVTSDGISGGTSVVPLSGKGVEEDTSFHLSANDIEVYLHDRETVMIKNGSGDYDIVNENPDIVDYDINEIHVAHAPATRSPGDSGQPITDDMWNIMAKKLGHATLKLTDKKTDEVLTLNVTVIEAPSLSLEKDYVELSIGEIARVEILTGSGWYETSVDDPGIVYASTYSSTVSGGGGIYGDDKPTSGIYVSIRALSAGHASIKIKDMSSYEEKTINVVVSTPDYMDLGLSVFWATRNIGASSPEEYGNYYAWGETETKDRYDKDSYKWLLSGDLDPVFSKYCDQDGRFVLENEDDVAYVTSNGEYRMPTEAEIRELTSNCTIQKDSLNGVYGITISAKNGNKIFLPAAGYGWYSQTESCGDVCRYWSSNHATYAGGGILEGEAFCLYSGNYWYRDDFFVYAGLSVRAVKEIDHPVASMDISRSRIDFGKIPIGGLCTGRIEITNTGIPNLNIELAGLSEQFIVSKLEFIDDPEYPNNTSYVDTNPVIAVMSGGILRITIQFTPNSLERVERNLQIKTNSNMGVIQIPITGEGVTRPTDYGPVDLGLSKKWANKNLGAEGPECQGDLYAWGETSTKDSYTEDNYKWYSGNNHWITKYYNGETYFFSGHDRTYGDIDHKSQLEPSDDAATAVLNRPWEMPSSKDCEELINSCEHYWGFLNGVEGCYFKGQTDETVFLPLGSVWSSSIYGGSRCGRTLQILNREYHQFETRMWAEDRESGQQIRPVYDE